ncbi:hypothetical protein MRX96_036259 [Rhipicephalus microplus]
MQLIAVLFLHFGTVVMLGLKVRGYAWSSAEVPTTPDVTGIQHWKTLYLTPFIKAGKLEHAKSLSKVGRIGADKEVTSYAGYITVNPEFNSNLFFWFVPSMTTPDIAPVLLWLQGGPGSSSLMGFFVEHGPYQLSKDGKEVKVPFTESESGYARDMTDVGRDMLEFLQQFFTLFGELAQNEFYVTGESYAGKYVPTIGAVLHQNAATMRVKINFRGIAIGNGFTDPVNMLGFGELLYGFGLIDRISADYMMHVADQAADCIRSGLMRDAAVLMDRLFFGVLHESTFFKNVTGMHYYYNLLQDSPPKDNSSVHDFCAETGTAARAARGKSNVPHVAYRRGFTLLRRPAEFGQAAVHRSRRGWTGLTPAVGTANRGPFGVAPMGASCTATRRQSKISTSWWCETAAIYLAFDRPKVAYELITAFVENRHPFKG